MHLMAEELNMASMTLRVFLDLHNSENIVITQDAVLGLLEAKHRNRVVKTKEYTLEEKFAYAHVRLALNVKHSVESNDY